MLPLDVLAQWLCDRCPVPTLRAGVPWEVLTAEEQAAWLALADIANVVARGAAADAVATALREHDAHLMGRREPAAG